MQVKVKEWGNSQGIRLPKEILRIAGIALDDVLEVTASNGVITLAKPFRHRALEEQAAEFDSRLMLEMDAISSCDNYLAPILFLS